MKLEKEIIAIIYIKTTTTLFNKIKLNNILYTKSVIVTAAKATK